MTYKVMTTFVQLRSKFIKSKPRFVSKSDFNTLTESMVALEHMTHARVRRDIQQQYMQNYQGMKAIGMTTFDIFKSYVEQLDDLGR